MNKRKPGQEEILSRFLSKLVAHVGQKCQVASSLDRSGQLTLVLCTSASHTAGDDFGTLRDIFAKLDDIFIVNGLDAVYAEAANLFAATALGTARTVASFSSFKSQSSYLLIKS